MYSRTSFADEAPPPAPPLASAGPSPAEYEHSGDELEEQLQRRRRQRKALWGSSSNNLTARCSVVAPLVLRGAGQLDGDSSLDTTLNEEADSSHNHFQADSSMHGYLRELEVCDRVGRAMFSTHVGCITTTNCCPPPSTPMALSLEGALDDDDGLLGPSTADDGSTSDGAALIRIKSSSALTAASPSHHATTRLAENRSTTAEVTFLTEDELQRDGERHATCDTAQPSAYDFPTHNHYLRCSTAEQRRELSDEAHKLQDSYRMVSVEERRRSVAADVAAQRKSSIAGSDGRRRSTSPTATTFEHVRPPSPLRRREAKRLSLEIGAYRPMDVLTDMEHDLDRKRRVLQEYQRYRDKYKI